MTKNERIETYYRENYTVLIKMARRRVGDYSLVLAEEAVQESFARALKYFKSYNDDLQFDNWFKRILFNTINDLKSDERNGGAVMRKEDEAHSSQNDVASTKEVVDLLNKSSVRDIQILNNYFFYGFKTREIAELMGISHDVVRDRIRTFRDRIRG